MKITDFKRGDKLEIVDVKAFDNGGYPWKDGEIVEVRKVLTDWDLGTRLDVWNTDKTFSEFIYSRELAGIKKLT